MYLLLRADAESGHSPEAAIARGSGQKLSGLTSQQLGQRLGVSASLAYSFLDELVKRRYIKRVPRPNEAVWELGDSRGWYIDDPVPMPVRSKSASTAVMLHLKASRERMAAKEARTSSLPDDLKRKLKSRCVSGVLSPEVRATKVRDVLSRLCREFFGKTPTEPDVTRPEKSIWEYCTRALNSVGDFDTLRDAAEWAFSNWAKLFELKLVKNEAPSWKDLGSKKLWREVSIIQHVGWDVYTTTLPSRTPIRQVLKRFEQRFMDRWGYRPVSLSHLDDDWGLLDDSEKSKVYAAKIGVFARFVKWLDDDRELALSLVDYFFDNWDHFAEAMDAAMPDILMFNAQAFCLALKHWYETKTLPKKREASIVDRGRE